MTVTCPGPIFQVIMNGITEIIRADPGLPQQVDRIVALSGGRIGVIGILVDIDPERYS